MKYTSAVCLQNVSNDEPCFPIVSDRSPAFDFLFICFHFFFSSFISILIYGCFLMVLWFFLVYQLRCPLAHKITMLPHCLGLLTCIFFIYLYFHLWMLSDDSEIFSQYTGFDVHRHAKFQLSTSPGRYQSLISVSEWVSQWLEKASYIRCPGASRLCQKEPHTNDSNVAAACLSDLEYVV